MRGVDLPRCGSGAQPLRRRNPPAHARAFRTDRCSMCTPAGAMLTAIKWKPRRTWWSPVNRPAPRQAHHEAERYREGSPVRRRTTRPTAQTNPCRRRQPGASARESPASPGKNREPTRQSQARPKKSLAPRKRTQVRLGRVSRSAGKESCSREKEPGSDEKEPREARWRVERGSPGPALGTESVAVGS